MAEQEGNIASLVGNKPEIWYRTTRIGYKTLWPKFATYGLSFELASMPATAKPTTAVLTNLDECFLDPNDVGPYIPNHTKNILGELKRIGITEL